MNLQIEKCLREIAERDGGLLRPEAVVESAKPKTSPLHDRFEWSDTEAAREYRLQQARQLIRVCVTVAASDAEPTPVFVSLSVDRIEGNGYRLLTDVLSDESQRDQLLRDALAELNTFARKYQHLRELVGVFRAARKVKAA